jgi:hypothetical protein
VHLAPELDGACAECALPTLFWCCEKEWNRLTDRFESAPRGDVVVYLFARQQDIGCIFGTQLSGYALGCANAILIAGDSGIQETLRHEFAHLFSWRWNVLVPPLLSEGLSVWLQETEWGLPIDSAARLFLGDPRLKLPLLLKSRFFHSEPQRHACYLLAGSFTGFLLRRYGWKPYRKLFRLCDGFGFRAKFQKCFGVTLEQAELNWRKEIPITEILN